MQVDLESNSHFTSGNLTFRSGSSSVPVIMGPSLVQLCEADGIVCVVPAL